VPNVSDGPPEQRVRIWYRVEGPLRYASVLEKGALWERLLRRAGMPLAYSHGFNPRPRLQLGTALPVGYASDCEVLDVFMRSRVDADAVPSMLAPQLPSGLWLSAAKEVPLRARAIQARQREAVYEVSVWDNIPGASLRERIQAFMASDSVPRERRKKGKIVDYDLRPLVLEIVLEDSDDARHIMSMRVVAGNRGSGRPEEVLDELGLASHRYRIRRRQLVLAPEEEGS